MISWGVWGAKKKPYTLYNVKMNFSFQSKYLQLSLKVSL